MPPDVHKDLLQAALLCEALVETKQGYVLGGSYEEAWDRGPSWQDGIVAGPGMMPDNGKAALAAALGVTVEELGKI